MGTDAGPGTAAVAGELHQRVDLGRIEKVGGRIALDRLSKKAPGKIKEVINSLYDVPGEYRNKVKNIDFALKEFEDLGKKYLGDEIPNAISSFVGGIAGIGVDLIW